jgi:predicted lipoprotein with Yx(FWY)xxD motif
MGRTGHLRLSLLVGAALATALAVVLLLVTRSGHASSAATRTVVEVKRNPTLGKRILVTRAGLTLYSLSAERRGRFICTTSSCLALWKPLLVPAGVKPTGVSSLTTVRRPDGKRQVAYRGAPVYRFVQDTRPGQVKGNGFRDVGVWRPVVVGGTTAPATAPSRTPYSY